MENAEDRFSYFPKGKKILAEKKLSTNEEVIGVT
jgi:hypothetical protein